jgi:hypothetical protein
VGKISNALRITAAQHQNVYPLPVVQIASPWVPYPSHLETLVWADVFGADALLTRDVAMKVPSVARARHLICPTIASFPLRSFRAADLIDPQPNWLHAAAGAMSPWHRMLWTIDDLIFHGWSLWIVKRGADGQILEAIRAAFDQWQFSDDWRTIELRTGQDEWRPADRDEVILIPGPHEGILQFGTTSIRQAADLADRATRSAAQPHMETELHYTGDAELTQPQIDTLIENYAKARRADNGGIGFTNKWTEVKEHGQASENLLIDGRNAAAVDVARTIGIPAAMIDAVTASAGLEYNTGESRNAQFIDYGLNAYMAAVTARLSMDDVVPHGQSVRMDTEEWRNTLPAATGPVTED